MSFHLSYTCICCICHSICHIYAAALIIYMLYMRFHLSYICRSTCHIYAVPLVIYMPLHLSYICSICRSNCHIYAAPLVIYADALVVYIYICRCSCHIYAATLVVYILCMLFSELEIQPSLTELLIPVHARSMTSEASTSDQPMTNDLGAEAL